jgi:hypothetical protein
MRARARVSDPLAANIVLVDIREVEREQALLLYRPKTIFSKTVLKAYLSLESRAQIWPRKFRSINSAVCNITFHLQSKLILHVVYCSLWE